MIRTSFSLSPEKIALSSVIVLSTLSAISPVSGYISLVSIGIGSFRLKSMYIIVLFSLLGQSLTTTSMPYRSTAGSTFCIV